jgi:Protein of unknown function (DUF3631)
MNKSTDSRAQGNGRLQQNHRVTSLDLRSLARALGGEVNGDQVLAPGPGHSPKDRSLSVKIDPTAPEGFVVNSFAGDDPIACRDYVRRKLGLPGFKPKKRTTNGGGRSFSPTVAKHVYRLGDGTPYLQVHRLADKSGFPQYHWDGEKWISGRPKGAKIPYMLPQLIAATPATPIYIVEGEKDVDNLAKIGFVATCNSEGADNGSGKKWTPELNQYFKDRDVYIVPDNDGPGRKHAEHVARNLNPVAKSVRIVELPGLPHKGDVSNWLESDSAGVKLAKLAAAAPLWEPTIEAKAGKRAGSHRAEGAAPFDVGEPAIPRVDRDEGAALLEDVQKFLSRFVAYPSDYARVAHVLWIGHAHLMGAWESTPRIAFLSPEPGSGKSRALEVSELLVPHPVHAVNVTPAYLFRKVGSEDGPPTILFDEIDTVFGPKAKENEDLRALLNSGHRRGAVAGRCVMRGSTVITEEIPSYSAVALAGLGWLPDTIMTRSVIVRMRRRAPDERIAPFRCREHAPEGEALGRRLVGWAATVLEEATAARPQMPVGVEDRNADCWEALLAVADIAGGPWPERARAAAVALVAQAHEAEPSLGIRLLADLRTVFGNEQQLTTDRILSELYLIEDAPWGDLKGKPLTASQLARQLKQYGVKSKVIRVGDATPRGYTRADLYDVWRRYLPSSQAGEPATSATAATSQSFQGDNVAAEKSEGATDDPEPQHGGTCVAPVAAVVEAGCASDDARNADEMGIVAPVAPVAPFPGEGGEPGLSPRDHAIDVTPAAEPAEPPADVIEPDDCDGELVAIVGCDGE